MPGYTLGQAKLLLLLSYLHAQPSNGLPPELALIIENLESANSNGSPNANELICNDDSQAALENSMSTTVSQIGPH